MWFYSVHTITYFTELFLWCYVDKFAFKSIIIHNEILCLWKMLLFSIWRTDRYIFSQEYKINSLGYVLIDIFLVAYMRSIGSFLKEISFLCQLMIFIVLMIYLVNAKRVRKWSSSKHFSSCSAWVLRCSISTTG